MKRKSRLIIALAGFLVLSSVSFLAAGLVYLSRPVVVQNEGRIFFLRPGLTEVQFAKALKEQNIISHPWFFSRYISLFGQNKQLKMGEYHFSHGATPLSIWRQVTAGKGLVYRSFTIIPGWTFQQLRMALQSAPGLKQTLAHLDDQAIMATLGMPQLAPEGEFYPETYYYTWGVTDKVILEKAFHLMQKKLEIAWINRASHLPYRSPYEALTAASLIEKEARRENERPLIAGVLINRLNKNMLLQFDPTIIYGLGANYKGTISKTDLKTDTLYNTYKHKGLPPTPIAMPSMASLEAALHPEITSYLYFVARGDGSHQFSATLNQHVRAVTLYNQRRNYFFNDYLWANYLHLFLLQPLKKPAQNGIVKDYYSSAWRL